VQPCAAQDSAIDEDAFARMTKRMADLESEVLSLRREQDDLVRRLPRIEDQGYPPPVIAPAASPAIKKPSYPTVKVGGFFQADAAWFDQSPNSIATVGDAQDGADFRRARLSASGQVASNVGYFMEYDFGFPGRPSFMDVYLEVQDTRLGDIRVGMWRQPIGMDGLASAKELMFIERALPFAFLPFRQIGAGFQDHADDGSATWAVSAFRFPTGPFGGNVGDNGGYSLAARTTCVPWKCNDTNWMHLGAGFSFGDPANDVVRYRSQPEAFVSETGGADLTPVGVPSTVPPFVDTMRIPTEQFNIANAEVGVSLGSLYVQSELYYAAVDRIAASTVEFTGGYVQVGYFLTGEGRTYLHDQGVYGRVKPHRDFGCCGHGAWEVAFRYSYLDLTDQNVVGGTLSNATAGLNWYLNAHTKFQLNYIQSNLANPVAGDSSANIVVGRAQLDF